MTQPRAQFLQHRPAASGCAGAAMLALIVGLLLTPYAGAGEVVVVLSGEAGPYANAEAGFRAEFVDPKSSVRTVLLKDVAEKGADATIGKGAEAVLAIGTPAAVHLHSHLAAPTPLFYCMVADPAGGGLTENRLAHGITTDVPLSAQFAVAAEALPKARSLGMLYRSNTPEGQRLIKSVREALPRDWSLEAVPVERYGSIAAAIDDLTGRHVDLVWTTLDSGIYDTASVRTLLLSALRNNCAVFGFSPAFVRAGALLGIGVDPAAQGRQAASLALRVLRGPNDRSIPRIQPPAQFQIAVNLIVADKIGVQLATDVVGRATYVFKAEK